MKFHQSFEKSIILTPDICKQSQTSLGITLKGRLRVSNEWSLEEAMYTNIYGRIIGSIPQFFFFFKFLKVLMVSE